MGVERRIRFPGEVPLWTAIAGKLAEVGEKPVVRMIDGLPAFPDEVPENGWSELRIGLSGGMITLRASGNQLVLVTWGTEDPLLVSSFDRLAWSAAEAGEGSIDGKTAAEYRQFRAESFSS